MPKGRSALRHPGQAHALNRAVAPSKEGQIAAPCVDGITKAANGEVRIERESRLHYGPCFVQLPEMRQRGREAEMRQGKIAIGLDAPTQPSDRFHVRTKMKFRNPDKHQPPECEDVTWREAKSFVDMAFRFRCPTEKNLAPSDHAVGVRQIGV